MIAFRIEDGDASWLVPAVRADYFDPDAVLTQLELGGKTVSVWRQPGWSNQGYLYVSGDVLWLIIGDEPNVSGLVADLP